MKCILDTNVVLDGILDNREPSFKRAAGEIFSLSLNEKIDAEITANSPVKAISPNQLLEMVC